MAEKITAEQERLYEVDKLTLAPTGKKIRLAKEESGFLTLGY